MIINKNTELNSYGITKLNVPEYHLKLPSTGKTVKYRPFLVKEEKLLFLAMETGEQEDMFNAVKNILIACFDLKSVERLSTFDIEYLFLKIRTKAVGENVDVMVTCPDDDETTVKGEYSSRRHQNQKGSQTQKEFKLNDEVALTMGYPSLDTFVKTNLTGEGGEMEQIFEMAASCAETIADENQVYLCKDTPKEELIEFLNQ